MKTIFKIGIAVIAVFLLLGCIGSDSNTSTTNSDNTQDTAKSTPTETQDVLTVTENTLTKDQYGYYSVQGSAVAIKDLKYVQIDVQYTDSDNAVVGSGIASTQDLKKGQTWKFKATGPIDTSVKVANASISEIYGY